MLAASTTGFVSMKTEPAILAEGLSTELTSYTVRQAATSLKLHPESVRDLLRQSRIQGFRIGRRWRISWEVLANVMKQGVPLSTERGSIVTA